MVLQASQIVLVGFFLGLSLLALLRARIRLPAPVGIYLPYLWTFFLAFTLADLVTPKLWIWVLAALSFLALREYFTLVDLRIQDRWGVLAAYLAIPFMFYYLHSDWYGMFIISVPVYAFLVVPFAVALGGKAEGAVFSVGVIELGLFLLVYCIGHVGYLAFYSTWMAIFLVSAVAICDLSAFIFGSRDKPPLRGSLLQVLVPAPIIALLGFALVPWSGIPVAHSVILGLLIPALVAVGSFTMDCLEVDLGIDRSRLSPGRGAVLNSMKSYLYTAPVVFHYLRYFLDAF
ncbi:MAG: phosphatidate cytidylyltransferase [Longimicrobiales bacterium]|nr:phosphatidate cytidylyltransferase [Longimicrobiales bacterium]